MMPDQAVMVPLMSGLVKLVETKRTKMKLMMKVGKMCQTSHIFLFSYFTPLMFVLHLFEAIFSKQKEIDIYLISFSIKISDFLNCTCIESSDTY